MRSVCIRRLTEIFQGFEGFINTNPKAPEFISLFIDENLKKGVKDVSCIVTNAPAPSNAVSEN